MFYLAGQHSPNAVPGSAYDGLENCPRTVLFGGKDADARPLHPFAKPLWLLEYLIQTYSNDGALVLDPTMGSGSTGVAAINTDRRFIGAENGGEFRGQVIFDIANQRISELLIDKAA